MLLLILTAYGFGALLLVFMTLIHLCLYRFYAWSYFHRIEYLKIVFSSAKLSFQHFLLWCFVVLPLILEISVSFLFVVLIDRFVQPLSLLNVCVMALVLPLLLPFKLFSLVFKKDELIRKIEMEEAIETTTIYTLFLTIGLTAGFSLMQCF